MMNRFQPLDASVLLHTNGIFSEHQLYTNGDREIYARKGNGYIRLMDHQATSASKIFWSQLEGVPHTTKMGRLVVSTNFKIQQAA